MLTIDLDEKWLALGHENSCDAKMTFFEKKNLRMMSVLWKYRISITQQQQPKKLLSVCSVKSYSQSGKNVHRKNNVIKPLQCKRNMDMWCDSFFVSCWVLRYVFRFTFMTNHNIFMPIYGNAIICINRIEFRDFLLLGYHFPIILFHRRSWKHSQMDKIIYAANYNGNGLIFFRFSFVGVGDDVENKKKPHTEATRKMCF